MCEGEGEARGDRERTDVGATNHCLSWRCIFACSTSLGTSRWNNGSCCVGMVIFLTKFGSGPNVWPVPVLAGKCRCVLWTGARSISSGSGGGNDRVGNGGGGGNDLGWDGCGITAGR